MLAKLVTHPISAKDLPICEIVKGKHSGDIIYLNQGPCCEHHNKIGAREESEDETEVDSEEEEYRSMMKKRRPQGKKCTKSRRCCKHCMGEAHEDPHKTTEINLKDNGMFQVIPDPSQPSRLYVFGASGSGKSYFVGNYAQVYQEFYPKNPIYLVSYVDEDDSIDKVEGIIRIPIADIMSGLVNAKEIPNSLIIFDDIDALPVLDKVEVDPEKAKELKGRDPSKPKDVFAAVMHLRDALLTTGRHYGTSVVITSHLGCDFSKTKVPINESTAVVVYPKGGNASQIERILVNYCGLTKKQLQKMTGQPSRWVMLSKTFPQYVVSEKGVYLV